MSTQAKLKRLAIMRDVAIDQGEPFDLAEARREYTRGEVWSAVATEVRAGRYVLEVWEGSEATCYEYGVRFVRIKEV